MPRASSGLEDQRCPPPASRALPVLSQLALALREAEAEDGCEVCVGAGASGASGEASGGGGDGCDGGTGTGGGGTGSGGVASFGDLSLQKARR